MNSYKLVSIKNFPKIKKKEVKSTVIQNGLPGFNREPKTEIRLISNDYYGFEYYNFTHEIVINESGIAFGFIRDTPETMNFNGYIQSYTIGCYLKRDENYAYLSAKSEVVNDLLRTVKRNKDLDTEIEEYSLDMQNLRLHVSDYLGAWFKKVSSRVTSSALFGSDLLNDPLYQQLTFEGAILTSVFIPYDGMRIQLNDKAGISLKKIFTNVSDELNLIQALKSEIIDKIILTVGETYEAS